MDKLNEYQGATGRLHGVRDTFRERFGEWKNDHPGGMGSWLSRDPEARPPPKLERSLQDYPHIYR